MHRGSRLTILVSVLLLGSAGHVSAQDAPALARGVALTEAADFELALEALNEADAAALSRDERVALYGTRAMVSFALGREDGAREDLARLLAMGAHASLPHSAPPELREALEALRRAGVRPPVLDAAAVVEDGVARIEARAEGGADLVRSVRIWVREGEWRAYPRVERPLAGGAALRWYAEALGPGEVALASEGTRAQPNVLRVEHAAFSLAPAPAAAAAGDTALFVGLGAGAAALVAGVAIALAVLLAPPSGTTQLSGPSLW
ncbi:MAG: hypothetical protein KF729_24600 [Sandaracinaceae bacterium]|nr:hypothetical protein [Sandaracinaceae bacterium]